MGLILVSDSRVLLLGPILMVQLSPLRSLRASEALESYYRVINLGFPHFHLPATESIWFDQGQIGGCGSLPPVPGPNPMLGEFLFQPLQWLGWPKLRIDELSRNIQQISECALICWYAFPLFTS